MAVQRSTDSRISNFTTAEGSGLLSFGRYAGTEHLPNAIEISLDVGLTEETLEGSLVSSRKNGKHCGLRYHYGKAGVYNPYISSRTGLYSSV